MVWEFSCSSLVICCYTFCCFFQVTTELVKNNAVAHASPSSSNKKKKRNIDSVQEAIKKQDAKAGEGGPTPGKGKDGWSPQQQEIPSPSAQSQPQQPEYPSSQAQSPPEPIPPPPSQLKSSASPSSSYNPRGPPPELIAELNEKSGEE